MERTCKYRANMGCGQDKAMKMWSVLLTNRWCNIPSMKQPNHNKTYAKTKEVIEAGARPPKNGSYDPPKPYYSKKHKRQPASIP